MAGLLGHRHTKGAGTEMLDLRLPRHISTLQQQAPSQRLGPTDPGAVYYDTAASQLAA